MTKLRTLFAAFAAFSLSALLSAEAAWTYDSSAKTITKDGVSINVGVWSGRILSIMDNRNRSDIVELDFTDGIEDASGNKYTIRQINGKSGFQGCTNLRRVVLPDETTSFGENAFKDCTALEEFVVGAGCDSIGWTAFQNCSALSTFTVPANSAIKTINPGAFMNCSSLTRFPFENCPLLETVNNNAFRGTGLSAADMSQCPKIKSFGSSVFQDCTALASVTFPADCPVTSIGASFFQNCTALTTVDLSICSNLTVIGNGAFSGCKALSRVDLPSSLTSLPQGAFSYHGSLATEGVAMLHVWFRSCPVADSAKSPFSHMFGSPRDYLVTETDMENASVTIHVPRAQSTAGTPNWNTWAGQWQDLADASASWNTDASRKIFALPAEPDGSTLWVTDWRKTGNIDNDAAVKVVFWDDPVQVEIAGPVCMGAFVRRSYTTMDFTATLVSYNTDLASSATLSVVLYSDAAHTIEATRGSITLSALGSSAAISISGLDENTTYHAVLLGVDSAGVAGDPVELGSFSTLWDEDEWTYYSDKGTLEKGWIVVSNVTASGTSLSVAKNSNNGDPELPDLDFTGGIRNGYELVSVGQEAFAHCTALTNVVLPATVTTVGQDAFRYDTALLSFAALGPVSIGSTCFYDNDTITNVFLPNVVSIGYKCFQSCEALQTLGTDLSSLRSIWQEGLSNCKSLPGDFVLTNLTGIGTWLFNGSSKITSVVLGEGVTQIPVNTFPGCDALTNVTVKGELTKIDGGAFGSHGPYKNHCSTPGHLNVYLTNVPDTLGNPFGAQYWATMSGIDAADSTIVVHIPYYNGVLEDADATDGTTEKFAAWAKAWQSETLESIVARGCPATTFELPTAKKGSGQWRNDVNYNEGAYVVRLAYYTDPDKKTAGLSIIVR